MKDLGLYAEAEVHEKEMEKCQIEIDRYYQDPEDDQDQVKSRKYDEAVEKYAKLEKLRDEVVKKMFGNLPMSPSVTSLTISLQPRLIPLRGLTYEV